MSVQALGWVLDHSPTRGSDRLVLISMANHAGSSPVDGAWESYPGVALLQREAGLERTRTVNDAVSRLIAAGHVERIINGAPDERIRKDRRPNLYRISMADGMTCSDTRCRWCGVTDGAARDDASRHDGLTDDDITGCRGTSPKPKEEPTTEPKDKPTTPAVDFFAAFWKVFPLKESKGDARRAWPKALKAAGGDADRIVQGAYRYRNDPNREEEFTAYPATWLNGERWEDDPLPARKRQTNGAPRLSNVEKSWRNIQEALG